MTCPLNLVTYKTTRWRQAAETAQKIGEQLHHPMRAEWCQSCNGFHIVAGGRALAAIGPKKSAPAAGAHAVRGEKDRRKRA